MTAKPKSTATFRSVSDTMSCSSHCFLHPRKSPCHISQSNLTAFSIWILTYTLKGEYSASHPVGLILDLTTNIQDRPVVEMNCILGTQGGISCIAQIPTESRSQNKQTKNTQIKSCLE